MENEIHACTPSFPPGFRFRPTDEELITYFLRRKASNQILPYNQIMEVNLYQCSPQKVFEGLKLSEDEKWYFFTARDRKYRNGNRPSRVAGNGHWKANGGDQIIRSATGEPIGYKKSLVYVEGAPKSTTRKTNWLMYEYRLSKTELDDWVLCEIHKVGKAKKAQELQHHESNSVGVDHVIEEGVPRRFDRPITTMSQNPQHHEPNSVDVDHHVTGDDVPGQSDRPTTMSQNPSSFPEELERELLQHALHQLIHASSQGINLLASPASDQQRGTMLW